MRHSAITRVGMLYQTKRSEPAELAHHIDSYLATRDVTCTCLPLPREAELRDAQFDLLVTLGGDGSMLRAARIAVERNIPLFGINFGRLGFLTEAKPAEWQGRLDQVLSGDYRAERRAVLTVRVDCDGASQPPLIAINDVALTRGGQPRTIRATLTVDGETMGEVACDGMVCSSATGSTGYNLSNGGPVLPPEFRGFVVTAVAPHLTWFHPLVLPEDANCRLSAVSTGGVVLTADGQVDVPVQPEQHVHVTVASTSLIFARTRPLSEFYATFRSRLQPPQ